jgi:hypothetical protein
VARKRIEHEPTASRSALRGSTPTNQEEAMNVMIGIDPHKSSHTAVAIDRSETELDCRKVRATVAQVDQLGRAPWSGGSRWVILGFAS